MSQCLSDSADPQIWLEKMREIAKKRMEPGNDNNTAIVVFLKKI
jgi:hypothetical protein